jgi:hypothetical protein
VGTSLGALAPAPLSIVQAVLSGGLVFLAVLAERYFGFRPEQRQWSGVLITPRPSRTGTAAWRIGRRAVRRV